MKINLSSYNHLTCINHKEKKNYLVLESYIVDPLNNNDCKEGMLTCSDCNQRYPIIDGIAIIVINFSDYCSERMITFGKWLLEVESDKLKDYLKDVAKNIKKKILLIIGMKMMDYTIRAIIGCIMKTLKVINFFTY